MAVTREAAIAQAATALRAGRVVACPTEAVYGLSCDPRDREAFATLLALKERPLAHGVLLIGASFEQLAPFMDLAAVPAALLARIRAEWPGPHTWIFPRAADVPPWLAGAHAGIALRQTAHPVAAALCRAFGGALISTSANRHGLPPARDAASVRGQFDARLACVIEAPVGGAARPTSIHDALSGATIRA